MVIHVYLIHVLLETFFLRCTWQFNIYCINSDDSILIEVKSLSLSLKTSVFLATYTYYMKLLFHE